MNRRDFLSMAGGVSGYSLFVRADGASPTPPTNEEISAAFSRIAPPTALEQRLAAEPHLTLVDLDGDVCVAGGGMAGVCAAVAAARQGAKVVLIQDRSRLGGNASSEVKMHIVGADCHGGRPGWREGGLIEEFRLDDAANNPQRSFEFWDLLLYDKVKSEPNIIRDNERIRFELLSIVLGVWDYVKNSGAQPETANWAMDWIGFLPGKRENRRLVGDYVLTQHDLEGKNGEPEDAVAIGGWPFDDHPPSGFDDWQKEPFRSIRMPEVYNIPFRCLYSRNIRNLLMAGRNISASHVAFSSTRVMATCSVVGQATGTAAALCARHGTLPRQLYEDKARLRQLQQTLLRDDQTIKGLRNEDPSDLARAAKASASDAHDLARPANVLDGVVRDLGGQWTHRWGAKLGEEGAWLQLDWDQPQSLGHVQLTFDTGFHRELTLSASTGVSQRIVRAPQPETVRDYALSYLPASGGDWRELVRVRGNQQRLVRHAFAPVQARALRLHITATNGDSIARVYEVRAYA